jgi:hypothetical protein
VTYLQNLASGHSLLQTTVLHGWLSSRQLIDISWRFRNGAFQVIRCINVYYACCNEQHRNFAAIVLALAEGAPTLFLVKNSQIAMENRATASAECAAAYKSLGCLRGESLVKSRLTCRQPRTLRTSAFRTCQMSTLSANRGKTLE